MTENYANNLQALQWYIDHGVDELLLDKPVDRTVLPKVTQLLPKGAPILPLTAADMSQTSEPMGAVAAVAEAQKLAQSCETLEALKTAIMDFDGLSVKKTATNMVFCDGDPKAPIMLIGEAPGADEDIQGKPFVGESGQLLDKILACIGIDRKAENPEESVYIANVLNWRPPGNRTPTQAEMDISLPFIERHIALIQPKMIIFCGGVAAKTILKRSDSISKMRGVFHDYQVGEGVIPAIVTYHPVYLLKTPAQKKAVWADMLMFQEKMKSLNILQ